VSLAIKAYFINNFENWKIKLTVSNDMFYIYTAPPNITWSSSNITSQEGSKVLIYCNITGSEPMTISWSKVGVGSVPGNTSILTLNNVKTGNNGGYQCTVTNGNECPVAKSVPTFLYVQCKCSIFKKLMIFNHF